MNKEENSYWQFKPEGEERERKMNNLRVNNLKNSQMSFANRDVGVTRLTQIVDEYSTDLLASIETKKQEILLQKYTFFNSGCNDRLFGIGFFVT